MNRHVDEMIPAALEAAEKYLAQDKESIPGEYSGYIASFGASVIQAGLKPAVAFNQRASGSAEKKPPMIQALLYILKQGRGIVHTVPDQTRTLLDYILDHPEKEKQIKKDVIHAATALKLAIRTFRLVKTGGTP